MEDRTDNLKEMSTESLLFELSRLKREAIPAQAGTVPLEEERDDAENVLKLWSKHREVARLVALGYKQKEICEILGLSQSWVSFTLNNNPLVQEQIAVLQGKRDASTIDVNRKVRALQPIALEVLEQDLLLEPKNIADRRHRADVAKTVLDRGGNGAISKNVSAHGVFTLQDLNEINERAALLRGEKPAETEKDGVENAEEVEYDEVG